MDTTLTFGLSTGLVRLRQMFKTDIRAQKIKNLKNANLSSNQADVLY